MQGHAGRWMGGVYGGRSYADLACSHYEARKHDRSLPDVAQCARAGLGAECLALQAWSEYEFELELDSAASAPLRSSADREINHKISTIIRQKRQI